MGNSKSSYEQIIEFIFFKFYKAGLTKIPFHRTEIELAAKELKLAQPKNLGDVIYSFRYRVELPAQILQTAKEGYEWIIRPAGQSQYAFVHVKKLDISPSPHLSETKILDSTPGIINKYALNDEQALLAKIRYNRLIDIFTGLTCYSLQNHLRTAIKGIGQVETDEIYIGVDKRGAHHVIPVQAKGGKDRIGLVQVEQDFGVCADKFPDLVPMPIAAQFMEDQVIALFLFESNETETVTVQSEKHYRLVSSDELTANELLLYQDRV